MPDPEAAIDVQRLRDLRRRSMAELGVIYDPAIVARIRDAIVARIQRGLVGEGITHAQLVREARMPSWVSHRGMLAHVLALVSIESYENSGVLLAALIRTRDSEPLPAPGFCRLLEQLGLVRSPDDVDACLELWDHHWKMAVTRLDRRDWSQE